MRWLFLLVLAAIFGGCAVESDEGEALESTTDALTGAVLEAVDHAGFALTANDSFATYRDRIAAFEAERPPATLGDVLASGNRSIRPLCHPTFLSASAGPAGASAFCWATGEDDAENVWVPQGLTGSGDANTTDRTVVVSWHTGNRHPLGSNALARVTFVDLATSKYRHVLLVEPTSNADYKAVASHADGLVWYGSKLFLAQGGYLRVFDLTHLWKMDSSVAEVGRGADGKYSGAYHAFALPQVGWFRYASSWTCSPTSGGDPCLTSLSLDRSNDSLVTTEYTVRRSGGRVVRWPLDPSTGLLRVGTDGLAHASEAFASPVWGMQGGVSYNGTFVLVGVCPEYAAVTDRDTPSCLHVGRGGGQTKVLTQTPKNTENVSYWPATNELWVTNEQLRERVTFPIHAPF